MSRLPMPAEGRFDEDDLRATNFRLEDSPIDVGSDFGDPQGFSLARRTPRTVNEDDIRQLREVESMDNQTNAAAASGNKSPDENNSRNPIEGSSQIMTEFERSGSVHTERVRLSLPSVEEGTDTVERRQVDEDMLGPAKTKQGDEKTEPGSAADAMKHSAEPATSDDLDIGRRGIVSDSTDLSEPLDEANSEDSMSSERRGNETVPTMPQALLQCMGENVASYGIGGSEKYSSDSAASACAHRANSPHDESPNDNSNSDGFTDAPARKGGDRKSLCDNPPEANAEAEAEATRKKPRLVYKTCRDNRPRVNEASKHRTIPEKPTTYFCTSGQEKLFEITILSVDCSIILGQIHFGIKAETRTTMSEVRCWITPEVTAKLDAGDRWEFYMPESGALLKHELEPLVTLVQYMDECTFGRQLLVRLVAEHGPAVVQLPYKSASGQKTAET